MKNALFAALAAFALTVAAAPLASAATTTEEPSSGTLTWAVPLVAE